MIFAFSYAIVVRIFELSFADRNLTILHECLFHMNQKIEIRIRHWVFIDDIKFFGPGRYELLSHIAQTGSISKAASAMGLSYKKAWAMVDAMNTYGNSPYVITQKGGSHGGGTVLTEAGNRVIEAYKSFNDKLLEVVKAEKELLSVI